VILRDPADAIGELADAIGEITRVVAAARVNGGGERLDVGLELALELVQLGLPPDHHRLGRSASGVELHGLFFFRAARRRGGGLSRGGASTGDDEEHRNEPRSRAHGDNDATSRRVGGGPRSFE